MYNFDYYDIIENAAMDMLGNIDYISILKAISIVLIFVGILMILNIICEWVIFKKAGRDGWESIIPIYNKIIKFQFLDMPVWLIILMFIPFVRIVVNIVTNLNLAKKFNKEVWFGIGLIILPVIFKPILAIKGEYKTSCYCTKCGEKLKGNYCFKCGEKAI